MVDSRFMSGLLPQAQNSQEAFSGRRTMALRHIEQRNLVKRFAESHVIAQSPRDFDAFAQGPARIRKSALKVVEDSKLVKSVT